MTDTTLKKLNALKTMMSIADDAGLDLVLFVIKAASDEEVKKIAKDYNKKIYDATYSMPYLSTSIVDDCKYTVSIQGPDKKIRVVEIID